MIIQNQEFRGQNFNTKKYYFRKADREMHFLHRAKVSALLLPLTFVISIFPQNSFLIFKSIIVRTLFQ